MDSAGRRRRSSTAWWQPLPGAYDASKRIRERHAPARTAAARRIGPRLARPAGGDDGRLPRWNNAWRKAASRLAAARRDFVNRLDAARKLNAGPFPAAGITLVGDAEGWPDHLLAANRRPKTRRRRLAVHGPRRSRNRPRADRAASFRYSGGPKALLRTVPLRQAFDRWRQKALLISIVLDEIAAGRPRPRCATATADG